MPLFACDQCNSLENTATCRFWVRGKGSPALCSACDPEIGRWHGRFERRQYDPEHDSVIWVNGTRVEPKPRNEIFELTERSIFEFGQTITNPVNCVGVMGKGLALDFKRMYPEMFEDYKRRCDVGELQLGRPYIWRPAQSSLDALNSRQVLVFPTKGHYRHQTRLSYVTQGLDYVVEHYQEMGIESLSVPALGCGLGGLDWNVVRPIMREKLAALPMSVYIFPPKG